MDNPWFFKKTIFFFGLNHPSQVNKTYMTQTNIDHNPMQRPLPGKAIRLFVTDLDGCMTVPFETPYWPDYTQIRALQLQSQDDPSIPPMSICTGRPMPYAEAQAQFLGIRLPFVFESGGGLYDLTTNTLSWNPVVTEALKADIDAIRSWAQREIFPNFPGAIPEFAKFTDVGLIHRNSSVIDHIYALATTEIAAHFPLFEVHKTDVSVNIIVKEANKGRGLELLSETLDIPLDQMAYIGDSSGDIPGLERVGMAFAPQNAQPTVKEASHLVTESDATAGVLEAYHWLIQHNLRI
jgi:hydroxymethylpyrimidine pyrophosphatase-like HAD family hydrolase